MKIFNNVMIGQKAFIVNAKKQLLIMKRKNSDMYKGLWDVPGGRVEEGDNLYQAIEREIKEESNLSLDKVILTLGSSKFLGKRKDKPTFIRNFFLCTAKGVIKLSDEHSEFAWIKVGELKDYEFPPDDDFQKVLKSLEFLLPKIDIDTEHSIVM